jgi:hypothetical protein
MPASTVTDMTPCAAGNSTCGSVAGSISASAAADLQAWAALDDSQQRLETFQIRDTRMSELASLQQLAQSLRGLPGRKTLVWASGGMQVLGGIYQRRGGVNSVRDFAGASEAADQNAYTYEILNSANIAVYPLDARHGANTSFADYDVSRNRAPLANAKEQTRERDQETVTMFQQIAAATGGKPCFNRTDLANCLKEDAQDSHDYYMLGFYVDKKIKPGWHAIELKLNNQKAEMRYRNGFMTIPTDPEKTKATDLQLAMLSPLPYTAVAINGHFIGSEAKGAKRLAKFELNLPPDAVTINDPDNHLSFDVVAVARGEGGKEAGKVAQRIDRKLQPEQTAQIRAEGIHYTNKLELGPGSYGVWFVVRDNVTGRTGSVMAPLTVQ